MIIVESASLVIRSTLCLLAVLCEVFNGKFSCPYQDIDVDDRRKIATFSGCSWDWYARVENDDELPLVGGDCQRSRHDEKISQQLMMSAG